MKVASVNYFMAAGALKIASANAWTRSVYRAATMLQNGPRNMAVRRLPAPGPTARLRHRGGAQLAIVPVICDQVLALPLDSIIGDHAECRATKVLRAADFDEAYHLMVLSCRCVARGVPDFRAGTFGRIMSTDVMLRIPTQ